MTAALVFDTETADYHDESQSADPVQIALVLSNIETGRTIWTYSVVISRRGWPTPRPPVAERVVRIHGMDTEYCNRWGEAPQIALDVFRRALAMSSLVVAHNIEFDVGVMTAAFSTMHLPPVTWPEQFCTMRESAPIVRIPSGGRYSIGGFKAPKLVEAHRFFTGREIRNAHDAVADVYACRAVWRGILRHRAEATRTETPSAQDGIAVG